jgi:hypothetical protein
LSEWVKSVKGYSNPELETLELKYTTYPFVIVFSKPEVIHALARLYEEYVLVSAYKDCNNIVFVCKTHYYNCILNELGIGSAFGNPTYTPNAHSKDEILQNSHRSMEWINMNCNISTGFLNFT